MTRKPKAALLPLYLELYDRVLPQMRQVLVPWLETVAARLEQEGLEIIRCPVCRIESEFAAAVRSAEQAGAELIFTLHLAYSPSLESADALARTPLPVVMIDTTMDYDFGPQTDPARLLYNHGVHGVQDLANVLPRRGKDVEIVAGHLEHSDAIVRAADLARAATAAARLRRSRAGRIGSAFAGMGDFAVGHEVLAERFGIEITEIGLLELGSFAAAVTPAMIEEELRLDRQRFDVKADDESHRRSVRVGLALRRCLQEMKIDAFSANFETFASADEPIDTVPFLEISKAMQYGVGYAGEGDVLTAALVAALLAGWPRTTFTEIFCPDWKGQSLFLSHMGEINPAVAAGKPILCEKEFPFTPTHNPVILACAAAPGPAVLVNLAPGPKDSFRLIVAPVTVLADGTHPDTASMVRTWIRPAMPVAQFLERYSELGGTHHSALVLGDHGRALAALGRMAGLETKVIG